MFSTAGIFCYLTQDLRQLASAGPQNLGADATTNTSVQMQPFKQYFWLLPFRLARHAAFTRNVIGEKRDNEIYGRIVLAISYSLLTA